VLLDQCCLHLVKWSIYIILCRIVFYVALNVVAPFFVTKLVIKLVINVKNAVQVDMWVQIDRFIIIIDIYIDACMHQTPWAAVDMRLAFKHAQTSM